MHTDHADNSVPITLTPRERQVMEYVTLGAPNKAIARAMNLSLRTVEHYRANLFHKLGVENAVGLLYLLQGDTAAKNWRTRMVAQHEERATCRPRYPSPP